MITPDSAILSPPRATFEQCGRYLFAHPSIGEYTSGDITTILRAYFDVCVLAGVDPLLAVAPLVHETGNLSSWGAARPPRNPARIPLTCATGRLNHALAPCTSER